MNSKNALPNEVAVRCVCLARQTTARNACFVLLCFFSFRFVACVSPADHEPESQNQVIAVRANSPPFEEMTPGELARKTADAYRNAESLEYEVRVTQSNYPARVECRVRHGLEQRVQLEVYENGELIYELSKSPAADGIRVVEKNHRGSEQADYVVAQEDVASGKWDTRCKRGISGCLFGAHQNSWVGTESRQASFFQEIISTAESVDLLQFDNQPCYFVKTTRLPDVDETVWIDAKAFAVLRWRYIVKGVERDRIFSRVILRIGGVMLTAKDE